MLLGGEGFEFEKQRGGDYLPFGGASNFALLVIDGFLWLLERLAGSCAIGCTVYDLMCYTCRPMN